MKIHRIILGQKGRLPIVAVVTLSILSVLGARVVKGPGQIAAYVESLSRAQNGESTNEDMQSTAGVLSGLANPPGAIKIPTSPNSVVSMVASAITKEAVELASRPTPPPGHPRQVSACGITVDPILAAYGEHVSATITIPIAFQSGIKSITAEAGAEGYNVPPTGGTFTFGIPCSAAEFPGQF